MKKEYYCTHGKPTLHLYRYFSDVYFEDFDTDVSDPDILWNRCTKLINDISSSMFKLFNYTESRFRELLDIQIEINDNTTEYHETPEILAIYENFKKILNNDPQFKNELSEIIFNNLMSFTESHPSCKEKTDELIKDIYDMYPIIYQEYLLRETLERLVQLIRYKILGVYEEDDLVFPDDEECLITHLSNKFEIVYHCEECRKVIVSDQDTKTFSKCNVCTECLRTMYSQISKYKRRKIRWMEWVCDEVESLIDS